MARIRDYKFKEGTVASASISADMPTHESGDVLIAFVNADLTTVNAAGGSWTSLDNNLGSGHSWRVEYLVATGSSHTYSTTLVASDTHTITVVAVKDAHATPIDANAARKTDDSSVPFAGIGVTTNHNNSLVFQFLSTDGGMGPVCDPPWTQLVNGDAGANSGGLAYMVQKTAGAVAAPNWRGQVNDNTNAVIVAIRDSGSLTSLPGYIQQDTTPGRLLEHGYWITAGGNNAWGNSYPTSLTLATIGSKNTVWDAATLQTDQGLNPYWPVVNCTPSSSTTGANVGGPQCNFGTTQNLTGGITLFNFFYTTSRDYVDCSTPTDSGQAGVLFVTSDGTAYKAWSVAAKGTKSTKPDGYNITAVQVDQSTNTRFASSGTTTDTAVARVLTLAQGRYGAVAFRWSNLCIANEFALAGGTTGEPLNFEDIDQVFNATLGRQRVMLREGSAATFLVPVKFGGTDPIHITVNLRTLQYRTHSDGVSYLDWHVDDNKCGFEFDGQASDTIHFTNCVFVSGSPTYWRFNAGHSASASIDFSGSVIINQTVTLVAASDLDAVTFIDCPSFTIGGATLTGCTFSGTKVSCATPAEAQNISDTSFESSGTGHAIEIGGTAASITLTGDTFDGYAVTDGSTGDEAIYVNIATGSMTINITGGGSTPSIRTAGATVTVAVDPVTTQFTVTDTDQVAISGARVLIETSNGTGPLPFEESITITQAAGVATVVHTAHGIPTGTNVVIRGATQNGYNKVAVITVTGVNGYTYAVDSGTVSPATGSPVASGVIIHGTTNGSGVISDNRTLGSSQPFKGTIRSSSGSPYYQPATVTGVISNTGGFTANIALLSDE